MRKYFMILLFFFFSFNFTFADIDYINDYTLIDCVNGDNELGLPFDNSKPYATLKEGIEKTISYINSDINIVGNETVASGAIFKIKVQCSFDDVLNKSIGLDYNGVKYNNELLIEGIDENSFIIKGTNFNLGFNSGNIIFKNARFLNTDKAYFNDYLYTFKESKIHPFSNGIKILDSYIELNNNFNIGAYELYKVFSHYGGTRYTGIRPYYDDYYNDLKNISVENSILNISIEDDFEFKIPTLIKDSKIVFNNKVDGVFDISFIENGNKKSKPEYNFSDIISNEIDLGGNNFKTENTTNISYLNNKFINVGGFDFSGDAIYINNYIKNSTQIDISNSHHLFNNVFSTGFIDSYDILNNRKNYSEDNISDNGIGWIFKRSRDLDFFNISINAASLYKEITGEDLPGGLSDIYVIFNY